MNKQYYKFHYNNKEFDFYRPRVMAIFNLTPDSFFDGGKFYSADVVLREAEQKLKEGAYILDLGAASTRPGAEIIEEEAEWKRLEPTLKALRLRFPEARISVDTFRASVARKSLECGADMINDVSGLELDPAMIDVLVKFRCPYVLMHSRGTPQTMSSLTHYDNVLEEVYNSLEQKIKHLRNSGVESILVDPGFGFAKNISQNFHLLKNLNTFTGLGYPVLVGLSRKSMIYKTLHTSPVGALNGTTALHAWALQNGASVLRVHDVKEAMEVIQLWEAYEKS
jgi:dihydropteroate synthase